MTNTQKLFTAIGITLVLTSIYLASGVNFSMTRHHQSMSGIPDPYSGKSNPLVVTKKIINKGQKIYQDNCLTCHGEKGNGDGPGGLKLIPPPANLNFLMSNPFMSKDDYLFWTLNEGGKSLNTAMPSFKEQLTQEEIWQVISFIKVL